MLIKKYGDGGTHVAAQQAALDRLAQQPPPARAAAADAQGAEAEETGRRSRRESPIRKRPRRSRRRGSQRMNGAAERESANDGTGLHRGKRSSFYSCDRLTMRFDVLTLFPEIFQGYLGQSLLKRAIEAGLVDVRLHNIRDWSKGKHNTVDDRPFGGGPGMVMKVEPVVECVEAVRSQWPTSRATWSCSRRKDAGSISRPWSGWPAQADPAVVRPVRRV